MNSTRFLTAFMFLGLVPLIPSANAENKDKPNILWITIEDTSPQFIGCYGNSVVKTPAIDKLAVEGVRFTSAFATGPVCSSSRSSIITGLSTEVMGTGHHRSQYPVPENIKGFPYFLRQAGYYTTNNSKTDYSIANVDSFISEAWNESSRRAGWWDRAEGQPFFSVFNIMTSHQSRTMTNPWEWYEKNIINKLDDSEITRYDEFEMPPFYRDSELMRKHFSRVYNSLNLTDTEIETLLDMLKADGLYDETIIFFYADHGQGIPRGKTNPIGLGYRVPFIVWFPEKFQHLNPWGTKVVTDELVSFHNLAPTVLSLAGIEAPDYMGGRAIAGKYREDPKEKIFMSRNRIDESPGLARSVSDGRYLYTRVFLPQYPVLKYQKYADVSDIVHIIREDGRAGLLNPVQYEMLETQRPVEYLYDLLNDPWEIHNLALQSGHEDMLEDMRKAVLKHAIKIKDVHFLPEYFMVKEMDEATPYDLRKKRRLLPIRRVVKLADKVGEGEEHIKSQLRKLKSRKPALSYWAAVGLLNQPKQELDPHKDVLKSRMLSSEIMTSIELAALLYHNYKDESAIEILKSNALDNNVDVALMALQKIQYFYHIEPFVTTLEKVIEKWGDKKSRLKVYEIVCCAEVSLHYYSGRKLSY